VHTTNPGYSRIYPGLTGKSISGTVAPDGAAVQVGLVGDVGHWIVPVAVKDDSTDDLVFRMRASFAGTLQAGPATLVFRAVDRQGHVGPPTVAALTVDTTADTAPLRITLVWDSEADLDLHVLAPAANGGAPLDVGPRKGSNLNPPKGGDPELTPEQIEAAGHYDSDSNAQCLTDGRRSESVTWTAAPTPGHYEVRVDTFSLCGEPTARWKVTVTRAGQAIDTRFGQSTDTDTRFDHGKGADLQVTYFDL
jgi:hypothetical protein